MAIQDEYDRDVDVEKYVDGSKQMVRQLDMVISILNAAVAFKTKYPADITEVNAGIAWVKNKCQNIIDAY